MEKEFTKKDLKTGMIVTTRGGTEYVVFKGCANSKWGNEEDVLCNGFSLEWAEFSEYDDDLRCRHTDLDIVKVDNPFHPYSFMDLNYGRAERELVWERKEVEEMTLEQVCKELGRDIKIVK